MPVRVAAVQGANNGQPSRAARAARMRKQASSARKVDEFLGVRGSTLHHRIAKQFVAIRDAKWFQSFIIGVIFLASALVGIQTYQITDPDVNNVLTTLDTIVLYVFIVEILVKFIAEGWHPWWFFKDNWNVFDFIVVAVGLMPFGGNAVTVLRLIRLLRVLKLVRALPKLRILVMGLLKSLSSIAYIGLLLFMLFYLYAVLGVIVFGANDPELMGTTHIAFLTLFRCATLEDWTDVMYTAMLGCEEYGYAGMEDKCVDNSAQPILAVFYFVSFIILSSMMILNLFIGVITSSMTDAKAELMAELEAEKAAATDDDSLEFQNTLQEIRDTLGDLAGEVLCFSELEKTRAETSVVLLSTKDVLMNKEIVVSRTDMHKAVNSNPSALKRVHTEMSSHRMRGALRHELLRDLPGSPAFGLDTVGEATPPVVATQQTPATEPGATDPLASPPRLLGQKAKEEK